MSPAGRCLLGGPGGPSGGPQLEALPTADGNDFQRSSLGLCGWALHRWGQEGTVTATQDGPRPLPIPTPTWTMLSRAPGVTTPQ